MCKKDADQYQKETTCKKCAKKTSSIMLGLLRKKLVFAKKTGIWWLAYEENAGMFCLLCRKHNTSNIQNSPVEYSTKAAIRFKKQAVKNHALRAKHKLAVEVELTSRLSLFEKEYQEREKIKDVTIYNAFLAAYWLAKEEMPNGKLFSLISLFQKAGVEHMKYFGYTSAGISRELFLILGEVVRETVLTRTENAQCFGLLTDEVTDIAVIQLLVTFIQYVMNGEIHTNFLFADNLLSKSDSANSDTIVKILLTNLGRLKLPLNKLSSFVSDGASVMTGVHNGVAAQLKDVNKALISVHCVSHRLALACTDTSSEIQYITKVHDWLFSLWRFFEKSPKKLAMYLKVQLELKEITLAENKRTFIQRRLKKACTTRWLSFDNSVKAFHEDYLAVILTLSALSEKEPKAKGLLSELRTPKFLGTVYILREVLPNLSCLSKTLQRGSIHYSSLQPALEFTADKLDEIAASQNPVTSLKKDLHPRTGRLKLISNISDQEPTTNDNPETSTHCREYHVSEPTVDHANNNGEEEISINSQLKKITGLSLSTHVETFLVNLLQKYVTALHTNLEQRFSKGLPILNTFKIFDPTLVPERGSAAFKTYGENELKEIMQHFYPEDSVKSEQLVDEWRLFKYQMLKWRPEIELTGNNISNNPTLWCLKRLLKSKDLQDSHQFELLEYVAEVALSAPVSNAWPERGASAIKRIKTRS